MTKNESAAHFGNNLDAGFDAISAADTADLSGVVTFSDDAFFDGIDYQTPAQYQSHASDLNAAPLVVNPDDDPIYQPIQNMSTDKASHFKPAATVTPSNRLKYVPADAYSVEQDDDIPWVGIIIGIVLALALIGALVWFFFGGGFNPGQDTPSTPEQSEPVDDEQDEEESSPVPTPVAPVTPTGTNDNEKDEDTPATTPDDDKKDESQTEPTDNEQPGQDQETQTQQKWVPEQGHWEPESTWVVDKKSEPIYGREQIGIEHHDAVYEKVPILDEDGNETGEYDLVLVQEAYDEPIYGEEKIIGYTEEEGHWETTQHWVVDVPGHWE